MSIVNCHIMSHCITPQNKASFVPGHGSKPMAGMNPTWCWQKRYANPPPAPGEGHFLFEGLTLAPLAWNSPWYPLVGLQPLMPSWGKREWSGLVLLRSIKHHLPVASSLGLYWSTNRCEKDSFRISPKHQDGNSCSSNSPHQKDTLGNLDRWRNSKSGVHRYIIYQRAMFTHSAY